MASSSFRLGLTLALALLLTTAAPAPGQSGHEIQRVGAWPYGPARAVGLDPSRNLVFLGAGGVCLVLDGTDRAHPVLINEDIHTQGLVWDVAYDAAHQRLFLACGEGGLEIWDVSDPALPVRLSVTEVLYFGYDTPVGNVDLWGDYAIVECEWGYVHSLDVSDPTAPVDVSFNGQMGNPARDIHVSTDGQVHCTGAQRYQRLGIYADGRLHNTGYKDLTYGPSVVYGKPDVAYLGYGGYCYIVDLLYPGWPFWAYFNPGGVGDLEVPGNYAYIVNSSGLHVWDVTVHNSPQYRGTASRDFYPYYLRVTVDPDYGYVAANTDGLQIAQIRDVTNPTWVGHFAVPGVTAKTVTDSSYAYVAHATKGLLVLELGDQTRPLEVGHLPLPGFGGHDILLRDGLAYVSDDSAGVRIVDVTDPANPTEVGAWTGAGGTYLALDGDVACTIEPIANQPYYLHTVDVSDPAQPALLGTLQVPTLVWGLASADGYVYVCVHDTDVFVIDIRDPANPLQVGQLGVPDPREARIEQGLLWVSSGDAVEGGLFTFDLADPATPAPVGHYTTLGFRAFHLDVEGDYAYLSDGTDLQLLRVADPAAPVRLDEYTMPGDLIGIHARDRWIYVSDGAAGLQIVENTVFDDPDGGLQWHAQDSGTSLDLEDLDFVDASRGWVVGDSGTILHTENGGTSWTAQSSGTAADLTSVDFLDDQNGWAVGETVIRTTDGGGSWQTVGVGAGVLLTDVCFPTPSAGWIAGDNGVILATTDAGATWHPQASGTSNGLFAVDFVDAQHGWATVADYGAGLRTQDGGITWTPMSTGSIYVLLDIDFITPQTGWAVGMFGAIVRTSDGGLTWQEQQGVHPPDWLYGVSAVGTQNAWTVGFAGKVMRTTDGGSQWEAQSSGCDNQLNAVVFTDRDHGWCCGDFGTILAWGPGTPTAVDEPEPAVTLVPGFFLNPNRPNPFGTETEIAFSLPRGGPATVSVFDVTGRLVKTLAGGDLAAGTHRVVWDGTDETGRSVASGVYWSVLRSGTLRESRKMVLLR